MSKLRDAAQQALEALEVSTRFVYADLRPQCEEAITALRTALAEQPAEQPAERPAEQEPVAWQWLNTANFRKKLPADANKSEWTPLYTAPQPAKPAEQEPVAWCDQYEDHIDGLRHYSYGGSREIPLYTAPQPRRNVTYVCPVCAASLERQE